MRFGRLGLRGKLIVALLLAAALPFLMGLGLFETTGFWHLLAERGKLHQLQAQAMAQALTQASAAQGQSLRTWLTADPAIRGVAAASNRQAAGRKPQEIARETQHLDEIWTSLPATDPLLVAVLENPGSASLRQYRALYPEVAEVLATDALGQLVAASGKSSDFNQADEQWWQKGATLKPGGRWIDVLRFDASSGVFSLDVVMPLHEGGTIAGVVKMSVDVTSLFAALAVVGEEPGEHWEIALPNGSILASSKSGFEPLKERLSEQTRETLRHNPTGWALVRDETGEARMTGFVGMGMPGQPPNAHVLFSSPRDAVVAPLHRSLWIIGLGATAVLTLCALGGFALIRRNLLRPLSALSRAACSISVTARLHPSASDDELKIKQLRDQAETNLAIIQTIRTGDEVEALAQDFAVMTTRILDYHRELEAEVAAKTAVIHEDLEMAREFQIALLPSHYPEVPPATIHNPLRLQFAHFYQPASTVGGDFFDLIELDDNRAGILIADVMGHGARSALVTAILRALVRNHSAVAADPGLFLTELNHHLREVISRSGQTLFVTAFFLVLDTHHGRASWAVAGHPPPLRVRRGSGKAPQPLWTESPHQPALGLIADAVFQTTESTLKSDDVFLLYTDGVIEAENPAGETFGIDRMSASLDEALDGPMAAMPAKIVCDVTAFQKRRHYDDDVCLVAVEAMSAANEGESIG